MRRDRLDSRSQGLDFFQDLVDLSVLSLHVLLDLEGGVENRIGILVGGLRTSVGGAALHVRESRIGLDVQTSERRLDKAELKADNEPTLSST